MPDGGGNVAVPVAGKVADRPQGSDRRHHCARLIEYRRTETVDTRRVAAAGSGNALVADFRKQAVHIPTRNAEGNALGFGSPLQLLFEDSEESPGIKGLGILKGRIKRIPDTPGLKIPDIGWNSLKLKNNGRLFDGIGNNPFVYFVHSYYVDTAPENTLASCNYGLEFSASVVNSQGNVMGTQFHPEKSGATGLRILRNFVEMC